MVDGHERLGKSMQKVDAEPKELFPKQVGAGGVGVRTGGEWAVDNWKKVLETYERILSNDKVGYPHNQNARAQKCKKMQ